LPGEVRSERQLGSELEVLRARVGELEAELERERASGAGASMGPILDAVEPYVLVVDRDGVIRSLNRTVPELEPSAALVGRSWRDFVELDSIAPSSAGLSRVFERGEPATVEAKGRFSNAFYRIALRPLVVRGEVEGAVVTATDITARKRVEERLSSAVRALTMLSKLRAVLLETSDEEALFERTSELLAREGGYAAVFSGAVDRGEPRAVWVTSRAGERFERFEARGACVSELASVPAIAEALRARAPVVTHALDAPCVAGLWPSRSAPELGAALVVPVCDGPHVLGLIVVFDREARRLDQGERGLLVDLAGDLAHGVRALRARGERRTMEEQLFQAQKMDAIGQLAGGIAHDFNNQLTGILGFAEFLSMQLTDDDLRDQAELIVRAAERSADLTAQLLAFARKGPFRSLTFDVHGIIHDVVAILERSIDKRIRITTELHAAMPFVQGDPHQLQNALLNLALNARDAMPGGGEIHLVTRDYPDPPAGGREGLTTEVDPLVCLEVRDQGAGISDEVRERMFEPFFTTKPAGKGTGMGLAAVYGTVQRHGGHLEVETALGVGSTFRVLLPSTAEPWPAAPPKRSVVPPAPRPGRILVVDDEPVVCALVESALEEQGFDVVTCQSPDEAIAFVSESEKPVDLVVLDMIMPRKDGRETFRALRARVPGLRVLLVSGYGLDDEAHGVLAEGAVGFLQKPFTVRQLLRRVRKALARGAPAAEAV
jgi:PAS domain S-box-containing protein